MPELIEVAGIALAGGVGAAARALLDARLTARWRTGRGWRAIPWGIMVVNLSGSLALGVVAGAMLADPLGSVLAVGFLGGYTTFSTASADTIRLFRERRTWAAVANGPGMLLASVALASLGLVLGAPLGAPLG